MGHKAEKCWCYPGATLKVNLRQSVSWFFSLKSGRFQRRQPVVVSTFDDLAGGAVVESPACQAGKAKTAKAACDSRLILGRGKAVDQDH
jgi:hypothetical protein